MSKKNIERKKKFENECIEAAMEGMTLHFIESVRARGGLIADCFNATLKNINDDPQAVQVIALAQSRFNKGLNYDNVVILYAMKMNQQN